jgi:capsular polysaccharide transport system ATP-binding protein
LTLRGRHVVFRDLSLELPGEVNIGLIGRNGAGKSTLMRLLSAVDMPDRGRIETNASLSWPVGLMGGMQGNLTGRENVKFVCRIHGIRSDAMREKIDYVQSFADIGRHFDLPVSTYSSGMRARVGFGTSMAFDFDYYLIDEILAVGDATTKAKSRKIFAERLQRSKVILVSHNMNLIRKMCDLVVYLQPGFVKMYPDVEEGIAAYQASGGTS